MIGSNFVFFYLCYLRKQMFLFVIIDFDNKFLNSYRFFYLASVWLFYSTFFFINWNKIKNQIAANIHVAHFILSNRILIPHNDKSEERSPPSWKISRSIFSFTFKNAEQ